MKIILKFISILLCFYIANVAAESALPLEQAFKVTPSIVDNKVELNWNVAQGYYLYTSKFNFTSEPLVQIDPVIPQGEFKYYHDIGRQEVLTGHFTIPLFFRENNPITLTVSYQGCSEAGFCYPPSEKIYQVNFVQNTITAISASENRRTLDLLFDQHKIKNLFATQSNIIILLLFFAFGLFLAFTPCVLPMLPILSSIIIGGKRQSLEAFILSFTYVFGAALAYALIGLTAAMLGQSLQVFLQNAYVIIFMSIVFLLLAAINFGWVAIIFPKMWQKVIHAINHRIDGGSYFGVFLMGVISTLIVSPCLTAPLLGALLYIAETGDKFFGAFSLFIMGMGLGVPLILAGTSLNFLLPRSGAWLITVKHFFGFLMVALAIWLIARVTSPATIYFLSAFFLLMITCYLCFILPRYLKHKVICIVLGLSLSIVGFSLMTYYAPNFLSQHESSLKFETVSNLSDLQNMLERAKKERTPVLVDFYADWCTSCLIMEKNVLSAPQVSAILRTFRLIRVDLSHNTADDQAIMKYFSVIAPPTFLFFDRDGIELTNKRIVGEVDVSFFLSRLSDVNKT